MYNQVVQDVISNLPGAFAGLEINNGLKVIYANEAFVEIFGSEADCLMKRNIKKEKTVCEKQDSLGEFICCEALRHPYINVDICVDFEPLGSRWFNIQAKHHLHGESEDVYYAQFFEITERKCDELAWKEKAESDLLTGIYNRQAFIDCVENILSKKNQMTISALLLVDLDDFKKVNDNHGHLCGDEVLRATADIIKGIFRKSDVVARLGGDEFIVFAENIADGKIAVMKARQICNAVKNDEECKKLQVTCSVGVAITPLHGRTFEELYQNVDTALYEAKHLGKNRSCLYMSEYNDEKNSEEYKGCHSCKINKIEK